MYDDFRIEITMIRYDGIFFPYCYHENGKLKICLKIEKNYFLTE